MDQAPLCRTGEDIEASTGGVVRLCGTYRRVSQSQRPRPVSAEDRAAAIVLDDGTEVAVEPSWSEASLRSEEEIRRFDGEAVVARGVVHAEAPAPPDPAAYVLGPCITAIEDIRLASEDPSPPGEGAE